MFQEASTSNENLENCRKKENYESENMTKSSSLSSSSSSSSSSLNRDSENTKNLAELNDYVADPEMKTEIEAAVGFLTDFLVKSPRQEFSSESVDLFRRSLQSVLYRHFNGHWHSANPLKGSGFRCLRINGKLDPLVALAAEASRLPLRKVRQAFPAELTVWVDPGDVSVRFGEEGSVGVWYAARRENNNDEEQQRPLKSRSLEENYQQQHHAFPHQIYQRSSPPLSSTPPSAVFSHHHTLGYHPRGVQYHPASPINAQFQQRQQSSPVWNPHWQPQTPPSSINFAHQQQNRSSPSSFINMASPNGNNGFVMALNHQQQQMQLRQTPIRYTNSPSSRVSPQPLDAEIGEDQRCKILAERLMRENLMPTTAFTPGFMASRPQPVGVGVN